MDSIVIMATIHTKKQDFHYPVFYMLTLPQIELIVDANLCDEVVDVRD